MERESTVESVEESDRYQENEEIYVDEEILNYEERDDDTISYARFRGIDSNENCIIVYLELPDGRKTQVRIPHTENARLEGTLRKLFYQLDIDNQDPEDLDEELIPVRRTEEGLKIDIPMGDFNSNEKYKKEDASRLSRQFRFWGALLSSVVLGVLLLLLFSIVLISDDVTTYLSILLAVVIQIIISLLLLGQAIAS